MTVRSGFLVALVVVLGAESDARADILGEVRASSLNLRSSPRGRVLASLARRLDVPRTVLSTRILSLYVGHPVRMHRLPVVP